MRTKSPQQLAERILAAAARLFASHRFHEARMEDVAALADVGKGTVYRYFRDKEELYRALLGRAADGLRERLALATHGRPCPRERLLGIVAGLVAYFDDNPHLLDLIQHAEVMQKPDEEVPWQKARSETMALVRDVLDDGRRAGWFRFDDVELAMLMLLGGLRAVVRFGQRPRPEGLAERIVAGFVEGHGG